MKSPGPHPGYPLSVSKRIRTRVRSAGSSSEWTPRTAKHHVFAAPRKAPMAGIGVNLHRSRTDGLVSARQFEDPYPFKTHSSKATLAA